MLDPDYLMKYSNQCDCCKRPAVSGLRQDGKYMRLCKPCLDAAMFERYLSRQHPTFIPHMSK